MKSQDAEGGYRDPPYQRLQRHQKEPGELIQPYQQQNKFQKEEREGEFQ
jgi:hypothetical protein